MNVFDNFESEIQAAYVDDTNGIVERSIVSSRFGTYGLRLQRDLGDTATIYYTDILKTFPAANYDLCYGAFYFKVVSAENYDNLLFSLWEWNGVMYVIKYCPVSIRGTSGNHFLQIGYSEIGFVGDTYSIDDDWHHIKMSAPGQGICNVYVDGDLVFATAGPSSGDFDADAFVIGAYTPTVGSEIYIDNLCFGQDDIPIVQIVSDQSVNGQVGQSFSYEIQTESAVLGFKANNLPEGLVIDEETGVISGTPGMAGENNVTITSYSWGGPHESTVNFNIVEAEEESDETEDNELPELTLDDMRVIARSDANKKMLRCTIDHDKSLFVQNKYGNVLILKRGEIFDVDKFDYAYLLNHYSDWLDDYE